MARFQHYYLISIQYLGFRYHGWAKQPGVKTIHHTIDRTINFIMEDQEYKTLGGSRTDAMVSANSFVFELFLKEPMDEKAFLDQFNLNLPADIKALAIKKVDQDFNIIQSPRIKEYIYLFAYGQKAHPFSASLLTTIREELDIELMKSGAKLFEGTHNFRAYCKKPNEKTEVVRSVELSEIKLNDEFTASFFPKNTHAYRIRSSGFLRNQIRIMMGQLFMLGKHVIELNDILDSLEDDFEEHLSYIAPASGLILNKIDFKV